MAPRIGERPPAAEKYYRIHARFADIFPSLEAGYDGSPEIAATSELLGRNVWFNAGRDGALQHLRELTRRVYPSIVWAT